MAKKGKKGTPTWVERLLNLRAEVSEDEYREAWRKINKHRRGAGAWEAEGRRIIERLERETEAERKQFTVRDFGTIKAARKAAEVRKADTGGRIVRRDARGRFSKRGTVFQVIGGRE